jgi:hypothetical protein
MDASIICILRMKDSMWILPRTLDAMPDDPVTSAVDWIFASAHKTIDLFQFFCPSPEPETNW